MKKQILYRDAGVDIDAGNRTVALLKDAVNATLVQKCLQVLAHLVVCFR